MATEIKGNPIGIHICPPWKGKYAKQLMERNVSVPSAEVCGKVNFATTVAHVCLHHYPIGTMDFIYGREKTDEFVMIWNPLVTAYLSI